MSDESECCLFSNSLFCFGHEKGKSMAKRTNLKRITLNEQISPVTWLEVDILSRPSFLKCDGSERAKSKSAKERIPKHAILRHDSSVEVLIEVRSWATCSSIHAWYSPYQKYWCHITQKHVFLKLNMKRNSKAFYFSIVQIQNSLAHFGGMKKHIWIFILFFFFLFGNCSLQ